MNVELPHGPVAKSHITCSSPAPMVKPISSHQRATLVKKVIIIGCVGVAGCTPSATPIPPNDPRSTSSEVVHFVGRVDRSRPGTAEYAWSGAGVVARFRGNGITVLLDDDKNEHQLVLDGKLRDKIVTRRGVTRYLVAGDLDGGEHRIELYRRTEAHFGVTRFLGFDVVGGTLLAPERAHPRRIEVVGDSISCGYGNEGKSTDCTFSAETENHYATYGAVLARMFGAELSTIAWSGRGVVKNYDNGPGEKMGVLYERILPESPLSRWQPDTGFDAVIVNLGTNDYSTEPDPNERDFVEAYVALLGKIRQNHPGAEIICTVGPMLGGQDLERAEVAIAKAVQQRRAAGDLRVAAHRLRTQNEKPGCDWHPSVMTHQRMAEELAVVIRAALKW